MIYNDVSMNVILYYNYMNGKSISTEVNIYEHEYKYHDLNNDNI